MESCLIVGLDKRILQFRCKRCNISHNALYKTKDNSYCEKCVPKDIKKDSIKINQNREKI